MNIQLNISYPGLLLILFIILSVSTSYVIYYYRKITFEFDKNQRIFLSVVKFLYLFLILFLLLSPLIERFVNRSEKPILIVGIDNSESIIQDEESAVFIEEYSQLINDDLSDKFSIEYLLFGEEVIKSEKPDFSYQKSNYSSFFREIEKRYFNMNVGAVMLIGDGIYNEGLNPEQSIDRINSPVFTVGIGDTITKTDQSISGVNHNPNVFLGNSFPVEVEMLFTEFPHSSSQLSIFLDNELVKTETIDIPQRNYYQRSLFNITAEQAGLKNVSLVLSPIVEEENTRNNRYNFTIEVHDNRKDVLILSQGPHPDIGAISTTLNNQANFNITNSDITLFNGQISDYDLVVLNQLPSAMTRSHEVFQAIKDDNTPLLLLVGPRTSIPALNDLELDFSLNTTSLSEESTPYFNESFALFSMPGNIREIEKVYPPVITHYTECTYSSEFDVLAFQRIKGIEMNYPLIFAGQTENRKTGAILGEGIWRWRLREYQNYNNQNAFNQIIVNLFNYLSLEEEREQFRISYNRIEYEFSPIQIKAQLFNEIFEPVENAEIHLTLSDSTGSEFGYIFDPTTAGYNLNLGYLPAGNYSFIAETETTNDKFSRGGSFNVQEVSLEQQQLTSNFRILNFISSNTGGSFATSGESTQLIEIMKNKESIAPKTHREQIIYELVDWKWVLLLILGLASLEWFLRKFWGSY